MKKVIAFLCLMALILNLCACGASSEKLFDKTAAMAESYFADKDSVKKKDIYENLKKLGLTEFEEACTLDRVFLESYLEEHTFEEFFMKFKKIDDFMMDYNMYTAECKSTSASAQNCPRRKCNAILKAALEIAGKNGGFELPEKGTPGFYSENSETYPEYFEKQVARGYNYGPDNAMATEYKPHYLEIAYHGDFAVYHSYGYKVKEGKLGWYNGVFIDEQSSWLYEDLYYVAYRGNYITDDYDSAEAAIAAAEEKTFFTVGDKVYYIREEKACGKSSHTYWDLGVIS